MDDDFSNFAEISNDSIGASIKGTGSAELIKIKAKKNFPYRTGVYWSYLFYFIASCTFLTSFFLISAVVNTRYGFKLAAFLMLTLIISFRLITVYTGIPVSVHELSGFQTKFSTDQQLWFYSIGDFLIDILLFSWFAIFVSHQLNVKRRTNSSIITKYAVLFAVFGYIIGGITIIQQVLRSIVFNPNIYFEFEDLSKIDFFTFLALFGVLILLLSFFIVANKVFRQIWLYGIVSRDSFIVAGLVLFAVLFYSFSIGNDFWRMFFTVFFSVLLVITLHYFSKEKALSFVWVSIWIFFFSVMATFMIEKSNIEKSKQNRASYLKSLLDERDIELEEKIYSLEKAISEDEFFYLYLSSPYIPYSQVEERLSYLYLDNAFFGRYKYDINIYNSSGNAKRPEHIPNDSLQKYLAESDKTANDNLYFQSLESGRYNYWSVIPLLKQNNLTGTIVIKLSPIEEEDESSVYVELMSNSKDMFKKSLNEYAVAMYKNKQLVYSKNETFPNNYNLKNLSDKDKLYTISNEGKDFVALRSKRDYIGISIIPEENYVKPFSIFSYLFCAGIMLVIMLLILAYSMYKLFGIRLFHISFKISLQERIQQGIVIVSLLSFVAIGIITIVYFRDEYSQYHKSRLERKIDSVVKTATWQLVNESDSMSKIPDAAELSEIHKIDVNIFNANGLLLSSSQDAVFGRRLISRQMNPNAYYKLKNDNQNKLTQTERINKFEYLSGYVPLKDKNSNTVAYLNLPYDFAGNSNLQSQDVAEFLGTLFNVYVIFLMLAALVAFALAKSVTRPLSIIGDKLRKIQVGGKNEKIDWKSRDEDITEFINRFNLMIEQLEASSRELARTQRESAWREMAKQVAHEIKNPLTPMKLQIQMLERASDKDPEMARDMIKKISKSLIGQIDILSNIASEFSSFAKLPAPKNEVFVLNRLLEDVCNLYTSEENMQLDLILPHEELSVFADPEQITRVLNNLIKNAIQSIPDNESGKIDVSLYKSASNAVIQVSDNGVGIPEDRKDSIFSPYFTTKSSGTGIGLTMSKGIIESAKGQMYFTSEEAKGSIFYVELPLEGQIII